MDHHVVPPEVRLHPVPHGAEVAHLLEVGEGTSASGMPLTHHLHGDNRHLGHGQGTDGRLLVLLLEDHLGVPRCEVRPANREQGTEASASVETEHGEGVKLWLIPCQPQVEQLPGLLIGEEPDALVGLTNEGNLWLGRDDTLLDSDGEQLG